jgi:hypothetical protein
METPVPVNISALKGILANAKKVMNKVETTNPIALSETTQRQIAMETNEEPIREAMTPAAAQGYTREQVMASNLPPAVKEAMIKNPIPQLTMPPSKFTLEDMSDLEDIPMIPNKKRAPLNETKRIVTSNSNSDMITISRTELKEMINESLVQFLTQSYNKTLTEDAIKKTINMLIKEGKLTVKKKN